MEDVNKACAILKCTVYDLILHAVKYQPEDIRDAIDTDGVFKAYVEHRTLPAWVKEFAIAVQWAKQLVG